MPWLGLTRDQQVQLPSEAAPQLRCESKLSFFSGGDSGGGDSPKGRDEWPLGLQGAELGNGRGGLGQTLPTLRFSHWSATSPALRGPSFSLFSHNRGF